MAVDQSTVYLVMMAIVGLTMLLASIFCKDNKKGINHVNHLYTELWFWNILNESKSQIFVIVWYLIKI